MKHAYTRVSTRKQFRDGNGLDEQIAKLNAEGYDELVIEKFSGSTTKRPRLDLNSASPERRYSYRYQA